MRTWFRNAFPWKSRPERFLLVAGALALTATPAAAQQCDVVRVVFIGSCASARIPADIDITVGDEPIVVKKQPGGWWEGHTSGPFQPDTRTISVEPAGVRTMACKVGGKVEYIGGGVSCRAVFRVPCEPLWSMYVKNTQRKKTAVSYQRQGGRVDSCPAAVPAPGEKGATQASIDPGTALTIAALRQSQEIVIVLVSDGSPLKYNVGKRLLEDQPEHAVKLSELRALGSVVTAGGTNPYLAALKKQQATTLENIILALAPAHSESP